MLWESARPVDLPAGSAMGDCKFAHGGGHGNVQQSRLPAPGPGSPKMRCPDQDSYGTRNIGEDQREWGLVWRGEFPRLKKLAG